VLTHTPWEQVSALRHGFLGAEESAGGSWEEVVARAGVPLPILTPRQVHGTQVLRAADGRPRADGLSTGRAGSLVGVVTADCMPVLLVDRQRHIAAAVHAGWRGAAAGVLEEAVAHLVAESGGAAADLEAVVGPAVGGCCYEVGPQVVEAFRARTGALTAEAWRAVGSRHALDLRRAASCLLRAAGVTSVAVLGPCTVCGPGYHSYRRDGAGAGRQLSFVGWA